MQTCYSGYFEHAWLRTPKVILSTCRSLLRLSRSKKSNSSPTFFWRYCKDMQTSYFGYFGHACLHTPKMIVSTCRTLRCLSACLSFLRYYILKNPAICLAVSILAHNSRTRTFPDMRLAMKSVTVLVFILDYFLEKIIIKLSKKSKKTYFGAILGPFFPNLDKNEFSWRKELCQFLNIPIIYQHAKNKKKLMSHS